MLDRLAAELNLLAVSEWGRIFATLLAVGIAAMAMKWAHRLAWGRTSDDPYDRRERAVWLKNGILLACALAILSIWASKIAGFALSLAAVAGAALIVSKELLLNVLGSVVLAVSRPFRIGDFVEMGGVRGRVVDTDWATTTLSETLDSHQMTGRSVTLPNSLLLSQPVRNESVTGVYMAQIVRVAVPTGADLDHHERCLLEAAREVSSGWIDSAGRHMEALEMRNMLDLPSAQPKVLLDLSDSKQTVLALRYTCRPGDRVRAEQAILRRYWRAARLDADRRLEAAGDSAPVDAAVRLPEQPG
ncbi:MAG TPA: mechanosensitive ion channel [Burkholderiaceae bacterium]|nr:mechanosensitive ion channel [Burkholderiaceae bacterium]